MISKNLIGISLAKNVIKYEYPIEENILQHYGFYDKWFIIVPKKDQDTDGTIDLISSIREKNGFDNIVLANIDWPTEESFYTESIDKILQQKVIDILRPRFSNNIWFHKHDIDEFLSFADQSAILNLIHVFGYDDEVKNDDITSMSTKWTQLIKSYKYYCWDPTNEKHHFVRNVGNISFRGNDASDLFTDVGVSLPTEVITYHTGYVKSEEQLTTKVKEHINLNRSIYGSQIEHLEDKLKDWKFSFPAANFGARCWPLGIADLKGQPNELEYFLQDIDNLPEIILENKDKFDF